MVTCADCNTELLDVQSFAERVPCPCCGSMKRNFSIFLTDTLTVSDHVSGQTQRGGHTVGYSESARQGTASSGDIVGGHIVHRIRGASPQGELDTMDTVRRLVQWLNRDQAKWSEPSESSATHTDAIAEGIGDNIGATLAVQVVRAIVDPSIWHQLSTEKEYTASLAFDASARMMWDAVQKKAGKIESAARGKLVLLLDANRCPGQAFPAVVEEYRHLFAAETRELGFIGVYVAGPLADSISALDC